MKITVPALFILTTLLLAACNSDLSYDKIEGFKYGEILVVILDLEDTLEIEKITLKSSHSKFIDSVSKKEIGNKKTIKLKCPQIGEGAFSVCVFTKKDTLCSKDSYVEGGYRPKLKLRKDLKNNKFEVVEYFHSRLALAK